MDSNWVIFSNEMMFHLFMFVDKLSQGYLFLGVAFCSKRHILSISPQVTLLVRVKKWILIFLNFLIVNFTLELNKQQKLITTKKRKKERKETKSFKWTDDEIMKLFVHYGDSLVILQWHNTENFTNFRKYSTTLIVFTQTTEIYRCNYHYS